MNRESFIFYRSFYEAIKELAPESQGRVYTAICAYVLDGDTPKFTGIENAIWLLIKPQLDANVRKYENGAKGGRPKKNPEETKPKPNDNQEETELEANVNDNVNVNENDNLNNYEAGKPADDKKKE